MDDRYLFKAKRVDNGEWIIGFLTIHSTGKAYIKPSVGNATSSKEVDKLSICQCTGMKDKDGNLIFDNDIVNAMSFNTAGKPIRVDDIVVNMTNYNLMLGLNSVSALEYVGNIFDKEMKENG